MNFILIPRNGSTSIASALELHHEHKRASEVPAPRCAVVRHPAERARSAYKLALTNPHSLAKACLGDAKTFCEFLQRDNLLTWPQSYWLDAPVDLLMRFETLPHMNQSTGIDIGEDDCEDVIARRYWTDFWRFGHVPAT